MRARESAVFVPVRARGLYPQKVGTKDSYGSQARTNTKVGLVAVGLFSLSLNIWLFMNNAPTVYDVNSNGVLKRSTQLTLDDFAVNPGCKIPLSEQRFLPPALCNKPRTRILLLSFFTTRTKARLWTEKFKNDNTLGLKNRICYATSRGYRYVIEVVDNSKIQNTVPIMFYKTYLVSHYLQFTDWLVWMDYDLIIKNPHNWFEQYLDTRFELLVTDHENDINNGAFMLRNSPWGRKFVEHWLFLCKDRNKYKFTDNGPFAEAVLRFGSNDLPKLKKCKYTHDGCYREMLSQGAGKGVGKFYIECLGKIKTKLMGPWNRTVHRDMGRIRFVSTASGFNSHGWEPWKSRGGKHDRETFFTDGMFVLHNKNFRVRVPKSSITCPVVQNSSTLIEEFVKKQGVYMLSSDGICDMDDSSCRKQHFGGNPSCTLQGNNSSLGLMSSNGIEMRKRMMLRNRNRGGKAPALPPPHTMQSADLQCGGKQPRGLSDAELWCYAIRYQDELRGMDAAGVHSHWIDVGRAKGLSTECLSGSPITEFTDGLGMFDPWEAAAQREKNSVVTSDILDNNSISKYDSRDITIGETNFRMRKTTETSASWPSSMRTTRTTPKPTSSTASTHAPYYIRTHIPAGPPTSFSTTPIPSALPIPIPSMKPTLSDDDPTESTWLSGLSIGTKQRWRESSNSSNGYEEHDWWIYKSPHVVRCPLDPIGPDHFRYDVATAYYNPIYVTSFSARTKSSSKKPATSTANDSDIANGSLRLFETHGYSMISTISSKGISFSEKQINGLNSQVSADEQARHARVEQEAKEAAALTATAEAAADDGPANSKEKWQSVY